MYVLLIAVYVFRKNRLLNDEQKKREIQATCEERREHARQAHTLSIESSRDMLRETFHQAKDVWIAQIVGNDGLTMQFLRAYEEAYLSGFPLSTIFLANTVISQMISYIV